MAQADGSQRPRPTPAATGEALTSPCFPGELGSIPVARQYVGQAIQPLHLAQRGVDTITLLVSELVTNAVVHAHSSFTVQVSYRPPRLRVEIRDGSEAPPRVRDAAPASPGGRGLKLVDELSDAWGCEPRGEGKAVWFEVDAGTDD
jgi:anti-sigma regulatory factor (Ser/Thr protein kinase)